ncbi:hypothetical protein RJ641_030120 [Dillenia turbinata]|uniref:Uncharacterized protein n=1 Tax=Dillenia turbinata TaxID=194707 RepID=A0AAN8ZGU3_9MAGN
MDSLSDSSRFPPKQITTILSTDK